MDALPLGEAHFALRGVHVHVDRRRVDFEIETVKGLRLAVHHVLIGGAHGVREKLVAHEAAVHEKVLVLRAGLADHGKAHEPRQPNAVAKGVHRSAVLPEFLRKHCRDAGFGRLGRERQHVAAVCHDAEPRLGVRERQALDLREDMRRFGRVRLHELASGGGLVEEVADFDAGSGTSGRGRHAPFLPLPGVRIFRRAAPDRHGGNGVNARQGLASEAERHHLFEFEKVADLARRVPHDGERKVVLRDPRAVVGHDEALETAPVHADFDVGGARVERIFHELLHHRSGPFDHFAGRDLAHQFVGKRRNRAARLLFGGLTVLHALVDFRYGFDFFLHPMRGKHSV